MNDIRECSECGRPVDLRCEWRQAENGLPLCGECYTEPATPAAVQPSPCVDCPLLAALRNLAFAALARDSSADPLNLIAARENLAVATHAAYAAIAKVYGITK